MLATSLPCGVLWKSVKIRTQGNLTVCNGVELGISLNITYAHGATDLVGQGLLMIEAPRSHSDTYTR
jgi:hypothetical protein